MLITVDLIIGCPLFTPFPLLISLQLLEVPMITTIAPATTYAVIQGKSKVIDKYHLWNKRANTVMIFWEWIRYILNI